MARKTHKNQARPKSKFGKVLTIILVLVILLGIGFYVYKNYDEIKLYLTNFFNKNSENDVFVSGELSIHFLELGDKKTGDCVYIKVGDTDILVDSGPVRSSGTNIYNYLSVNNKFVKDNVLEYVIVTHADQDHIAGFAGSNSNLSLFDRYECKTIIDFPLTNKTTQVYSDYIAKRNAEVESGAKRYSALECFNQAVEGAQRIYALSENVELEILYNYYYENTSADENNYSVCFMINQGDRHYLFTGDLEKQGEEKLVEYNNLPEVELFKAGHHGSKTSSNDVLLEVIKPKICVVTCVAGSNEYTNILKNTFPTQDFVNRISKYTTKVYVTSIANLTPLYAEDGVTPKLDRYGYQDYDITSFGGFNGNIVINCDEKISVSCSVSNTVLKDSQWFGQYRVMPEKWAV